MSHLPPDPGNDHPSEGAEHEEGPPAPPPRAPLIPAERLPQFGCGFTLWLPLLLILITLLGYFIRYHWFNQLWVFSGVPLFGMIVAVVLMATRKRRWFGVGLLVGLLFSGLIEGLLFWIILTSL